MSVMHKFEVYRPEKEQIGPIGLLSTPNRCSMHMRKGEIVVWDGEE